MSRDPVCGVEVDGLRARAVGIWGGRTYYFCSPEHRATFARDPAAYLRDGNTPAPQAPSPPARKATPVTPPPARKATPLPSPVAEPVARAAGEEATATERAFEDSAPVSVPRQGRALWIGVLLFVIVAVVVGAALALRR